MREPKLGVAVGKKGVGKTYTTNLMIDSYVKGNPSKGVKPRRVLILDVNDEYEGIKGLRLSDVMRFSVHPTIEARRVRPFSDNGKRWTIKEIQDALFYILETFRGGMLLIEDINRYISDFLPNDIVGAICTNRHTDTDIIMHFQSVGRITPKIWQNLNWVRFHKNTDSVDRHRGKFEDKYEMMKIMENMVNNQYYNGNQRFYLFADVDEEKIYGKYNDKMFNEAMDEYLSQNYRKVVAPVLNEKDGSGKKKYTAQQAMDTIKAKIKANYCK
jgi:hypothetical protein